MVKLERDAGASLPPSRSGPRSQLSADASSATTRESFLPPDIRTARTVFPLPLLPPQRRPRSYHKSARVRSRYHLRVHATAIVNAQILQLNSMNVSYSTRSFIRSVNTNTRAPTNSISVPKPMPSTACGQTSTVSNPFHTSILTDLWVTAMG